MDYKNLADFFEELQFVRGRSLNTVMAYRRDLELYEEFQKHFSDISRIYEFLTKRQLSVRSQARVISSIRTYLRFCEKRGEKAPHLRQLRPPKVKVALPKAISVDEFQRLYNASTIVEPGEKGEHKSARNHMTLMLLFGLGCRVSELINLNTDDLNMTDGYLSVTGKGNKQRLVPLTANLLADLRAYMTDVRPHLIKEKSNTILVNDKGHRPSRVDIWRWMAAWSKSAGFDKPISPHKFRHGCATALLEGGADLRSIQMLLGHSSIQTTQIYTNVTTNKMREEIDTHHPLAGMSEKDIL
jgi:integrase/recombinase XerD